MNGFAWAFPCYLLVAQFARGEEEYRLQCPSAAKLFLLRIESLPRLLQFLRHAAPYYCYRSSSSIFGQSSGRST